MTRNDCFTAGRTIVPKGIMIHSTATPGVMAAAWFSRWNKSFQRGEINRQMCVHAFLDDREAWQYLPWNHRGWHAGGAANNTHIGIEICEPAGFTYAGGARMVGYDARAQEKYFRKAWDNAVALCVMLCRKYRLTEREIICHSEGHRRGIASNHADVMHWFVKHGESMDTFRGAVRRELGITNANRNAKTSASANTQTSGAVEVGSPSSLPVLKVGDVVEIAASATVYYPGGPRIPEWVKRDFYHKITQVQSRGKTVIRGGKECVLLGRRVGKKSGREEAGIMTWVDKGLLEKS